MLVLCVQAGLALLQVFASGLHRAMLSVQVYDAGCRLCIQHAACIIHTNGPDVCMGPCLTQPAVRDNCRPAGLVRHQTPPLSHLASLKGAFAGLGVPFEEDEEAVDTPMAMGLPDPRAPVPTPPQVPHAASFGYTTAAGLPLGQQLGINMLALAVPQPPLGGAAVGGGGTSTAGSSRRTSSNEGQRGRGAGAGESTRGPEEVILCFGIIDILQVRVCTGVAGNKCAALC